MMSTEAALSVEPTQNTLKILISKELRAKANEFLNSRRHANNLVDIVAHLKQCQEQNLPVTSTLLTLEVIFTELLKRREMCVEVAPLKPKDESPETRYRDWLREHYEEVFTLALKTIENGKISDACQALVTCMKLLAAESKNPLDSNEANDNTFPKQRFRSVLQKLLSPTRNQANVIHRFKEYAQYLDVVFYGWKLLQFLANRSLFENETFALNYLELLNALPLTQVLHDENKLFCPVASGNHERYAYAVSRKFVNKVWNSLMQWSNGMNETVHRQVLIVLLERVLTHLDKPIQLTDFLMDSLDSGGAISLLALQGIFTLIQKYNVTYPNIYEKLYSMFEPEVFHTKFKARLFYLADIFLSSTHLPEGLVAAFIKRLARLSLIAPPQDAIIIFYFIGNLILRHPGLKRLISAQSAIEYVSDPYIMEERDPIKSNALESSLWEIVCMQKHAVPSVATAARFISQPLPTTEWDLSGVLEVKEDDIFDQEISKKTKQYALAFERPQTFYLTKNDVIQQYWKLF